MDSGQISTRDRVGDARGTLGTVPKGQTAGR